MNPTPFLTAAVGGLMGQLSHESPWFWAIFIGLASWWFWHHMIRQQPEAA